MPGVAKQPLDEFLDSVAEATPAPGGGSSSAVVAGLAAALVEMAARLGRNEEVAVRAGEIRESALSLAEQELSSYEPVLQALRLPGDDPSRGERVAAALLTASAAPLAIAEGAAEVAALGAEVAGAANPSVAGDALAGVVLAEGAAAAAARLVEINLEDQPAAPALEAARTARARAKAAREAATG